MISNIEIDLKQCRKSVARLDQMVRDLEQIQMRMRYIRSELVVVQVSESMHHVYDQVANMKKKTADLEDTLKKIEEEYTKLEYCLKMNIM